MFIHVIDFHKFEQMYELRTKKTLVNSERFFPNPDSTFLAIPDPDLVGPNQKNLKFVIFKVFKFNIYVFEDESDNI